MNLQALTMLAILVAGCAAPAPLAGEGLGSLDPGNRSGGLGQVLFVVVDDAVRPIAGAVVQVGELTSRSDETGTATMVLPEGSHAWQAVADGHDDAQGVVAVTAAKQTVRVTMAQLPADWVAPQQSVHRTMVACAVNVLVPFGHACALLDDDPEGQWQFTISPDVAARSQWRIEYAADRPANYAIRIVTPSTGAAGVGGQTIGELLLNATDVGEIILEHGQVGPGGDVPLDVVAGAKIIIFVRGDVASPAPLQGTPAGHGIGARLDHQGQLFLQQWDPRGPWPARLTR